MTRVRLSVDVDPELRRRVKMVAAARDQSVKEWIEEVVREALVREARSVAEHEHNGPHSAEDRKWLQSDLSRLGGFEPYEWMEGELEEGRPVGYEPGVGVVIEDDERIG